MSYKKDIVKVLQIESGPVATNGYILIDTASSDAVIIDVPYGSANWFKSKIDENRLNVQKILLTHTHWDHTADCYKLMNLTEADVYVHKLDNYRLAEPMKNTVFPLPFDIEPVITENFINSGDIIKIGDKSIEVIHTPGHTEGGLCFVVNSERLIFVGDTLFNGSIGRTDLPGGSFNQLMDSIRGSLMTLPDDYTVYSGHGPASNIGQERNNNPFII